MAIDHDKVVLVIFECIGLCVFLIAVDRFRSFLRRRSVAGSSEARCVCCNYIIHPGSFEICPECGKNLLQCGVQTTKTSVPMWRGPWFTLVALLLLLVLKPVAEVVAPYQPFGWSFSASLPVFPYGNPATKGTKRFDVSAHGRGRYFGKVVEGTIVIYPEERVVDRPEHWLDVDPRPGKLSGLHFACLLEEERPWSTELLDAWLLKCYPKLSQEQLGAARQAVLHDMDRLIAGDFSSFQSDFPARPENINYYLEYSTIVCVAVVCYVIGIVIALSITRLLLRKRSSKVSASWRAAAAELGLQSARDASTPPSLQSQH